MNAQELTAAQLEDEVAKLSAHMNAGMCRWLELVAELDRRGCWIESGSGSCAEWLAWRCAISPRAARDHVRVARRLPELPLIRDAFARGELSYTKVRALTRVATPESQGELLRLGRALTAAQLDRAVAAYRRVTAAEAEDLHSSAMSPTSGTRTDRCTSRAGWRPKTARCFCARSRPAATRCGSGSGSGTRSGRDEWSAAPRGRTSRATARRTRTPWSRWP